MFCTGAVLMYALIVSHFSEHAFTGHCFTAWWDCQVIANEANVKARREKRLIQASCQPEGIEHEQHKWHIPEGKKVPV